MIKQEFLVKQKFTKLFWRLFNWLENNGNADFFSNGEVVFIQNIAKFYANKKIIVFDIGANVGDYSKIIVDEFAKQKVDYYIHLFEPTLSCFNELKFKFQSNSCFTLNRFGVSDAEGEAEIYYDKEKSGFASLYQRNLEFYNINLSKSETISLIRLDNYIQTAKIEHVHLLKIDIEGHEIAAWKGMAQFLNADFVDFIQFEYVGSNLDSHTSLLDIYSLLEKAGFIICKVKPKCLEPRSYRPNMDNFEYANYVAVSNRVFDKIRRVK